MIHITRLNDKELVINCDLIECMESTPDTMITMTTGHKLIARESVDEIIEKIIEYKRRMYSCSEHGHV